VNTLGSLTVNGSLFIGTSNVGTALGERQLKITTPTVANSISLFGSDRMLPIKAGMGMAIYQTFGNDFVTIDGPYNCENSYYPQAYPNLIQVLNETRKELKALKGGTNVSISDDGQIMTISAPNVYSKDETTTFLNTKATATNVYTKDETTALLNGKATTTTVYTKDETTAFLNDKANKSETYSDAQVDQKLSLKAASADTYLKTDVYTQTETNTRLALKANNASPAFTGTATAANLTVDTQLTVNGASSFNGTAVEIVAPLNIKCLQTAFDKSVIIGALMPVEGIGLFVSNNATIYRNLTVNGDLTVNGNTSFANPYWVALVINFTGGNPYIVRNGGRYAATSLVRVSGQATGIVQFDFPEHPEGTNYLIDTAGAGCYATLYTTVRTSTRIGIVIRDSVSLNLIDREVHVLILAY
jgi:hypothetical protein